MDSEQINAGEGLIIMNVWHRCSFSDRPASFISNVILCVLKLKSFTIDPKNPEFEAIENPVIVSSKSLKT